MSAGHLASHGQVLSPNKWNQAKASAALRKSGSDRPADAPQFVPLLDWHEDRRPSQPAHVQRNAFKVSQPSPVKHSSGPRSSDTAATASDASISSSSDAEFCPGMTSRSPAVRSQRKEMCYPDNDQ